MPIKYKEDSIVKDRMTGKVTTHRFYVKTLSTENLWKEFLSTNQNQYLLLETRRTRPPPPLLLSPSHWWLAAGEPRIGGSEGGVNRPDLL